MKKCLSARRVLSLESTEIDDKFLIDNLEITKGKINYGAGTSNPMKNLFFWNENEEITNDYGYNLNCILPEKFSMSFFTLLYKGNEAISEKLIAELNDKFVIETEKLKKEN